MSLVQPDAPLTLLLVDGREIRAERWHEPAEEGLASVVDAAGYLYLVSADQVAATIVSAALIPEMLGEEDA